MIQPLFVGQRLELRIEKLSFNGGRGLSRDPGIVVFVEGAAPKELVLAEITRLHKRHAEARIVEVLDPGPERRRPPCTYYEDCGGCSLQHLNYAEQIRQKIQILQDVLRPLIQNHSFELKTFVPAPKEFHYRNRAQFHLDKEHIGFHRRASHALVDVENCLIVEENINQQLSELRRQPPPLRRIELRSEAASGENFFSQVNSAQNLNLQNQILEIVQSQHPLFNSAFEMWDLYGGAGNFSQPVARKFPNLKILCVEGSAEAVRFGREQAEKHGLHNIRWVRASVEDFLARQESAPRLLLLDPPRAGLSQKARIRLESFLNGSKLIYLSCNPASFVRDAQDLMNSSQLQLRWVQGYDMFPQTDHIELLSFFD